VIKKIKALSLKQPYANFIAEGRKTIETRVWSTNYRGDLLICSSKTPDKYWKQFEDSLIQASTQFSMEPKGMALCIIELYDIQKMTVEHEKAAMCEVYKIGSRYAQSFFLRNLRVLKNPFPVKGELGIFEVTVDEKMLETL
jgi:hypothetical protein